MGVLIVPLPKEQKGGGLVQFACSACDSPAVTLPKELHDRAPVHCQGCGVLIATWGVFKQTTTEVILAEVKQGTTMSAIHAPDPLDEDLLRIEGAAHVSLRL